MTRGPSVIARVLLVMGRRRGDGLSVVNSRISGNGLRIVNNRVMSVMAPRQQETTFQALNRGLKLDKAAVWSTIRVFDRIHDRFRPSWADVQP